MTISLPAAFRKALVHRTFRGLRFILKFLWHLRRRRDQCRVALIWQCRVVAVPYSSLAFDSLESVRAPSS